MTATSAPATAGSAGPADDRAGGHLRLLGLFESTALSVSLAALSVPTRLPFPIGGLGVGVVVSAMAIFLLTSIPARWASRGVLFVGAILILRYGSLRAGGSGLSSLGAVAWGVSTAVALVLSSRLEDRTGTALRSLRPSRRRVALAQVLVVTGALVGAGALAGGSTMARSFARRSNYGQPPGPTSSQSPLVASSTLDMTTTPRLSGRLVMTVRTDHQSFLRDATYDEWDGQVWRRSRPELMALGPRGQVTSTGDDLGARHGTVFHQEIRLEAPSSDVLPAAPSAVSVASSHPLAQWADGDLISAGDALGRGASYEVTSRQLPVTAGALEASATDPIPPDIARRYAAAPVATPRVRALAHRIAAGSASDYDDVQRIEAWLGAHTTYSINAPVATAGRDVVDDFLFRSKVGWCEQIASSLVVLLRANGVPARLATGFVPGDWDPILEVYRVRERDAHAWAEVWFPRLGWVPFDPTAHVPLAGSAGATPSTASVASRWLGAAVWILLAVAAAAMLLGPALRLARALDRRVRASRRRRGVGWVAAEALRLERLGAADGRPREPWETVAGYASALSERWKDARLGPVGEVLDEAVYGTGTIAEDDPRAIDVHAVIDELAAAPRREHPAGVS